MTKDKELERLKREITKERKKVQRQSNISKQINVKKALKKELFELQNPKRFSIGRRIKRGSKILASKVGKGLLKQGRLIKEQQERESNVQRSISRPKKLPKLTKNKRTRLRATSENKGSSFFAPLDF